MSEQPKVEEFDFEWKSTAAERYDTEMMTNARTVFLEAGLAIVEEWGGSALGRWATDEENLVSDNGLSAITTLEEAGKIASVLTEAVGHLVKVTTRGESV